MAELVIQNPSITTNVFEYDEAGRVSAISGHPLAGEGGGTVVKSDLMWKPNVESDGYVHWTLASSATTPEAAYISGAQGPQGPSGTNGTNGVDGISPTFTITPTAGGTHVTISGAQGKDSFDVLSGAKGADGTAGFSPTVSTTTTAAEDRTGTVLTFTYGDAGGQTVSYTAWNGKDGTGATVDLLEGTGIQISHTGTSYTIGVSADYALKSELPNLTDYYKKTETSAATALSNEFAKYTIKPDSSLVDKYLVLRTDNAGNVSGWYDLKDQCYSKTEAQGTFVATAYIDNATLSGDGKSVSTKLGVKTDVIPTKDYVNSSFLPLSGGTVSGDVIIKSAGTNLLAVNTTATLMGQSRVNSLTDTTAIGTNWLGVNSLGGGFLKNVQGGNVGALNGTSIQINFAPDGANSYGNITVESQGNQSKVVHVPTASYDSMTAFDPTNGPNYMLRKTASGFDIGAKVVNVTSMPQNTEANTYYFVYEV